MGKRRRRARPDDRQRATLSGGFDPASPIRLQFSARTRAGTRIASRRKHADVAQLVAHHLAKVRVAGSNPVVRSARPPTPGRPRGVASGAVQGSGLKAVGHENPSGTRRGGVAEWLRQGPAKPCTRVRFPPPPRAISSVGERYLDTVEVTGSIPVSPTSTNTASLHDRRCQRKQIGSCTPHQTSSLRDLFGAPSARRIRSSPSLRRV